MSRIFKSNYVKIGTPKHIKSNTPAVIKHDSPKPEVIGIPGVSQEEQANNIIEDAKQMYLRIIEEANFEAQKIMENAQLERESMHTYSMEQGYSDGHSAGFSEGMNKAQAIIQKSEELKLQLEDRRRTIYEDAEAEIMELVLDISRKVIGDELTQRPEVILSQIKQALQKCAFKSKLAIRVSDQDYDFVSQHRDQIIMLTEGINELEINCDKALPKGSCIVETPSGEINAGIHVQMNEIQKAFEYIMRNE